MTEKKLIGQPHDNGCAACDLQDKLCKEIGYYNVMLNNLRLFADTRLNVKPFEPIKTQVRIVQTFIRKLWELYFDAVGLCKHGQLMERE